MSQIEKAAESIAQMADEWFSLNLSETRKATFTQLIALRLERFWPEVHDSCGCVFCDIDLEPFKAEGFMWHQPNGAGSDPIRCTKSPL